MVAVAVLAEFGIIDKLALFLDPIIQVLQLRKVIARYARSFVGELDLLVPRVRVWAHFLLVLALAYVFSIASSLVFDLYGY